IATIGDDHTLRLWDAETGLCRKSLALGAWTRNCISLPRPNSVLADTGESFRLVSLAEGAAESVDGPLGQRRGRLHCLSRDGRTLVTSDKGTLSIWDWPQGRLRKTIELSASTKQPGQLSCEMASLSPDARQLLTSSYVNWQSKNGDFVQSNIM